MQSKGGANSWDNLVACCSACNSKKGDKSLEQLRWKLRQTPKVGSGAAAHGGAAPPAPPATGPPCLPALTLPPWCAPGAVHP